MRICAFDLETIADRSLIPGLPEPKPAGNLKDPAKISADISEKRKKQIDEMGLNPMTSLICVFGFADSDGQTGAIILDGENERDLLLRAWDRLATYDKFVTFNGRGFDLPTLYLHSMRHKVRAGISIDRAKYARAGSNHTDMRQVLSGDNPFASGTLDQFARHFLGESKTKDFSGDMVQQYWDLGMWAEIAEYCVQDCKLTLNLYNLAVECGLLETL